MKPKAIVNNDVPPTPTPLSVKCERESIRRTGSAEHEHATPRAEFAPTDEIEDGEGWLLIFVSGTGYRLLHENNVD